MTDYLDLFIADKSTYCELVTLNYYKDDITYFINFCNNKGLKNIASIDCNLLRNYILYLRGTDISNVSIHTYYRAVKVFIRWLFDNRYIDNDYTLKIKLPKNDAKLVLPLTVREVNIIDNYFTNDNFNGIRNYCLFHLMLDCGLRRSEVINLNFKDIKDNNIYIRLSKNNKSRIVLCPNFLKQTISNYYNSVPNKQGSILFYDRYNKNRITDNSIRKIFSNLKHIQGVERIHPHLCRHTFATSYAINVGNLEMLRLLLGHADYNITQNYLHLANQQKLVNGDVYKIDDIYLLN